MCNNHHTGAGSESGASMIEYVVITAMLVTALALTGLFLPDGTSLGLVGNAFLIWFQEVQAVLSLPLP